MQTLIDQCYRTGIVFISPEYKKGIGDTTIIKTETESLVVEKNIRAVIINLAKYLFLDLNESRNYYKEFLGKGKNLPLVLNEENIFICLKTRYPIGKNDGAMTFLNPKYIDSYGQGLITLKSGEVLPTFTSDKTIKKNLKDHRYILGDMKMRA